MAFHSHQPIGNFDNVFEEATEKAYEPFLRILEAHPHLRVSLHYSGCLLDWLCEKKPRLIRTLKTLIARNQIELLGGGYYEPILPIIPEEDRLGQLRLMRRNLKKMFGSDSQGAWLTERVWEPALAKSFSEAGVAYTIVDDTHFKMAGFAERDLIGYFVTEDSGKNLFLFPASEKLRYLIPFKEPQETIAHLRSLASGAPYPLQVYADDGEKFGLWPGTAQWVYGEGWLERFFRALEENRDWIELKTFSEVIRGTPARGTAYLPCASYREMLEWSGGYFRNFFVKYPEGNRLHKRMLWVSERLRALEGKQKAKARSAKTGAWIEPARTHLYKAQCNCAYWHGVFGGLYLGHLRSPLYRHLIEAEKIMDEAEYPSQPARLDIQETDFDRDGGKEIIVTTSRYDLYFDPARGGSLFELDDKKSSVNLLNTLSRRQEPYHEKIRNARPQDEAGTPQSIHGAVKVKESGLEKLLVYDRTPKSCLLDHFFGPSVTADAFAKVAYEEWGYFAQGRYSFRAEKSELIFSREGDIERGKKLYRLRVEKRVRPSVSETFFRVVYTLRNLSSDPFEGNFGVEFNFSVYDPALAQTGEKKPCRQFSVQDQWFGVPIHFDFSAPVGVWHFPVETVSDSEGGLEHHYQELGLLFHQPVFLKEKEEFIFDLSMRWGALAGGHRSSKSHH